MKRFNRNLGIFICCALLCSISLTPISGFAAEPERIAPVELKLLIDSGEKVVVVDVRSARAYREAHVPGAISIPLAQLGMRHSELPKEGLIVFY